MLNSRGVFYFYEAIAAHEEAENAIGRTLSPETKVFRARVVNVAALANISVGSVKFMKPDLESWSGLQLGSVKMLSELIQPLHEIELDENEKELLSCFNQVGKLSEI